MESRAARAVRVSRSALGFAGFGAWCLALAGVALPLYAFDRERERRERRAQRVLQRGSRSFLRFAEGIGCLRIRVVGAERLQEPGPHLLVANHPSLVDFVAMCSLLPQADCIVKADRAHNPFLAALIGAAGFVRHDAGPLVVAECVERLRRGRNLVVFPEGTRSPARGLGPFQRGTAHIALRSGVDVTPVRIRCDPPALFKGQKWYDLEAPFLLTVRVGEPVSVQALRESLARGRLSAPRAARELTAQLREIFAKELDIADAAEA